MSEQEARRYLSDLERGGAGRVTGIRTAFMEFSPRTGYRLRITDAAMASKRREVPTYVVPAPWTPVLHERNATWYVCPDLLAAQAALGFTPEEFA